MLPRAHRLHRSAEFALVVRRGRRAAASSVVVHALIRDDEGPERVGFVVSRAVGNAVRRNRVRRQLQHLVADRWDTLPTHSSLVVRTTPAAGAADRPRLMADLDQCLAGLRRRTSVTAIS